MRRLDKRPAACALTKCSTITARQGSTRRSTACPQDADVIVVDTPGPRRPGRPRRDPQGRHSGHADERQLRRPRPDRPGPPRELQDHQAELLRRADLEQPHRSAPRHTGKSVDWVVLRNRLQHVDSAQPPPRRRRARRACPPRRLPGHPRPRRARHLPRAVPQGPDPARPRSSSAKSASATSPPARSCAR